MLIIVINTEFPKRSQIPAFPTQVPSGACGCLLSQGGQVRERQDFWLKKQDKRQPLLTQPHEETDCHWCHLRVGPALLLHRKVVVPTLFMPSLLEMQNLEGH